MHTFLVQQSREYKVLTNTRVIHKSKRLVQLKSSKIYVNDRAETNTRNVLHHLDLERGAKNRGLACVWWHPCMAKAWPSGDGRASHSEQGFKMPLGHGGASPALSVSYCLYYRYSCGETTIGMWLKLKTRTSGKSGIVVFIPIPIPMKIVMMMAA